MKRIDRVYELLMTFNKQIPVSAGELASKLGLTRANCSNDLNALVKEGKAKKIGTKPVRFYPVKDSQSSISSLADFTEQNPSLVIAVDQIKAAVLYPPQRMHVLLSGETGVGKSMFAELIFQFSQNQKRISADAKLVVFNCADYAHNSQLIMGNIFGICKGAYTGAHEDRSGLIEQADGGILFLDEVHRLPPEAQEMLFTFIDKNIFRRLGETAEERHANVQIIAATTEDIHSSLLQTFIRRIPMRVHLPNLKERGITERLNLITRFFNEEAQKLNQDIEVSMNSLRALLGYECRNNIGQLKSDIQLLCARSYARHITEDSLNMTISSFDLPSSIKEGLYNTEKRKEIWSITTIHKNRFILFKKDDFTIVPLDDYQKRDIYELIDQKLDDMEKIGLNQRAAMDIIDLTIKNYFSSIRKNPNITEENVLTIVGNEIFSTTKKVLEKAERILKRKFDTIVFSSLSLHLFSMINRLKNGETIINPRLEQIQTEYPDCYKVALQCKFIIETAFSLSLPEDEAGFIAMFFIPQELMFNKNKMNNVEIIVIAHGETTASSMADVVNSLLGNDNVVGFNMPLSYTPKSILDELKAYFRQKSIQDDTLLLVDMGSLTNFPEDLKKVSKGDIECIDLVSTLHVLEASRKASLGYSLSDIKEAVYSISHNSTVKDKSSDLKETMQSKIIIVTSCTTGEGSAQVIKDLLLSKLQLHENRCVIKPLQILDSNDFIHQIKILEKQGKIICCIGTFTIDGLGYPQITINELLTEGTMEKLQKKIDYELTFQGMLENIAPMINNLDGEKMLFTLKNWVENIEIELNLRFTPEIMIGLICHLACVIDNNYGQEQIDPLIDAPFSMDKKLLENIKILEEMYTIRFNEKEVRYIHQYLLKV